MSEPAIPRLEASAAVSEPAAARPKVMRRPAQFSASSRSAEILPITPRSEADYIALPTSVAPTPAAKPWQEDGRFGAVLLVIIIVLNLAASVWLSRATPAPTPPAETIAAAPEEPTGVSSSSARDEDREDWYRPDNIHILDDKAMPVGE